MNIKALRQFDLNSLVTLKVLLDTQHVTQAAEHLNLTQSAVSRSLAKLREALDDPILVRSGKGLSITKQAELILPKLNQILSDVNELIEPKTFNPAEFAGKIRLATTDYGTHNLLPKLVPLLHAEAPNLQLATVDWRSNLLTELEENKVDLMVGGVMDPPPNIHQRIVADDSFVGVMRKGHPCEHAMDLKAYLAQEHVMISSSGHGQSRVDELLESKGLSRKVVITVPHFFAALEIVSATDCVILLPSKFVRRYVDIEKFSNFEPPFSIPRLEIAMFWHARTHRDPINKWFRQFLYEKIYARRR